MRKRSCASKSRTSRSLRPSLKITAMPVRSSAPAACEDSVSVLGRRAQREHCGQAQDHHQLQRERPAQQWVRAVPQPLHEAVERPPLGRVEVRMHARQRLRQLEVLGRCRHRALQRTLRFQLAAAGQASGQVRFHLCALTAFQGAVHVPGQQLQGGTVRRVAAAEDPQVHRSSSRVSASRLAQLASSMEHARLHRVYRAAHDLRDLAIRVAVIVGQLHHRALIPRQGRERGAQTPGRIARDQRLFQPGVDLGGILRQPHFNAGIGCALERP